MIHSGPLPDPGTEYPVVFFDYCARFYALCLPVLTFVLSSPRLWVWQNPMKLRRRSFTWELASLLRSRLAREENWGNSPRVASRIADAINLAKRIYDRLMSDYPKR
jgi:hypothetical protein